MIFLVYIKSLKPSYEEANNKHAAKNYTLTIEVCQGVNQICVVFPRFCDIHGIS